MTQGNILGSIHGITPVPMPHRVPQDEAMAWIMKALQRASNETGERCEAALGLYERLLGQTGIGARHTILDDYVHQDWDRMELYRAGHDQISPWYAPPLEARMKIFADKAFSLLENVFEKEEQAPDTLIEVSCTGYKAPYPAQSLLLQNGWQDSSTVLKLGHMGCHAALPATNLAARLAQSADRHRDICVLSYEFCSMHLKPKTCDAETIVANTLFADGAVRWNLAASPKDRCYALLAYHESLIPGTAELMAWSLASSAFEMTLSRRIPLALAQKIEGYVDSFLRSQGVKISDIKKFAVHPGGPRIIETVQKALRLEDHQVAHSKDILYRYGNMSSATIPHIWHAMLHDPEIKDGDRILSIAFGPGLTVAMNLLEKETNIMSEIMTVCLSVFLGMQAILMIFDEWYFHRKRGLGRFERWGHVADTGLFFGALCLPIFLAPTSFNIGVYIFFAVTSSLLVTKDEWIHAKECGPAEQWCHSVLFLLHGAILVSLGILWTLDPGSRLIRLLPIPVGLWGLYQFFYWNTSYGTNNRHRDHQQPLL